MIVRHGNTNKSGSTRASQTGQTRPICPQQSLVRAWIAACATASPSASANKLENQRKTRQHHRKAK
jgi:hypothetical protein